MTTSVTLQNPFSYSFILLLALIIIIVFPIILYLIIKIVAYLRSKGKKVRTSNKKKSKPVNIEKLKIKYLDKIEKLEEKQKAEKISGRQSYLELSEIVREFVQESTGVKVSNYSLGEIKTLSMPSLYVLIEQFYKPEFGAEETEEGIENAFKDARRVVTEWN